MESIDALEKRKIVDLIKQGKDGAESGSTMDWMYSDNITSTDDYLLGKKIDKHFEKGDPTPTKEDDIFGERIKANIALDMQAKMREDPLYAIKKREEESKRKIFHNPVKMKELQKLIAHQKKRKNKKNKKKLKHSGLNDADDYLVHQYLSILTHKHKGNGHHSASSDISEKEHKPKSRTHKKGGEHHSASSDSSEKEYRPKSKTHKKGRRHRSASSDSSEKEHRPKSKTYKKGGRHRSASTDSSEKEHRPRSKTHKIDGRHAHGDTSKRNTRKSNQHRTSSSSEHDQIDSHRSVRHQVRARSRMSLSPSQIVHPTQKRYGLIKSSSHQLRSKSRSCSLKVAKRKSSLSPSRYPSSNRSEIHHSSRSQQYRDRSSSIGRKGHESRNGSTQFKSKVGREERERRIQEMMENAKWREVQRKNNVKRFREEDQQEEDQRKEKGRSADFLNPLMAQHATNSTVEDRLRRNKYNIQRTKAALNKDFTRH